MPAVTKIAPPPADDVVEVYRIQDRNDGAGPYNPKQGAYFWEMIDAHGHDPKRPGPFENCEFDDPYAISHEHLFGFGSRADAAAWFDGYLGGLHDRDYVLAVFQVRECDVMRGKHQIVFKHEGAVAAGVEDVLDLVDHLPTGTERAVVTDYDADDPDEDDLDALSADDDVAAVLSRPDLLTGWDLFGPIEI